jgi:hypothetical protein
MHQPGGTGTSTWEGDREGHQPGRETGTRMGKMSHPDADEKKISSKNTMVIVLCVTMIILASLATMVIFKICSSAEKTVQGAGEAIEKAGKGFGASGVTDAVKEGKDALTVVAKAFKTGSVKREFISYVVEINKVNRLQVAESKMVEEFYLKDSKSYLGIPLPDVEFDWRVPVTYAYYIDLNSEWDITLDESNSTIMVQAPPIKANEPAPDISQWERKDKTSAWRMGEEKIAKKLQDSMTPELKKRALLNIEKLNIFDQAKKSVVEFVRTWWLNTYLKGKGISNENIVDKFKFDVSFMTPTPYPPG